MGWQDPGAAPVLWATEGLVGRPGPVWESLRGPAAGMGLVPLLLDRLQPGDMTSALGVPRPTSIEHYGAAEVLQRRWNMYASSSFSLDDRPKMAFDPHYYDHELDGTAEQDPFFVSRIALWDVAFPGLAPAEEATGDQSCYQEALSSMPRARVGLAVAGRPADVPHLTGWQGAAYHFLRSDLEPGVLSVVMRSWEDRYGAVLVRLSPTSMQFLVERPPSTASLALAVAAEHFAFAGYSGLQGNRVVSVPELADLILGSPLWRFWWD